MTSRYLSVTLIQYHFFFRPSLYWFLSECFWNLWANKLYNILMTFKVFFRIYRVRVSSFRVDVAFYVFFPVVVSVNESRIAKRRFQDSFCNGILNSFAWCNFEHCRLQFESKSILPEVFFKKLFLKISQNLQENTYAGVPLLIKLRTLGLQLYLKSDFGTDVSMWILRHF